jgi:hypothetical protein
MGAEMNKFLSELTEGLSWIFLTPDEARRMLRQDDAARGITYERREQGAFSKAA